VVYKVGATLATEEIGYWEPLLPVNHWMWIEPDPSTGLPPAWSDPLYAYCARVGAMPVLATHCEGDTARLTALRAHLIGMPAWIGSLWVTDRPEPEDQVDAATFIAEFAEFWAAVETLPLAVRSRIEAGPVLSTAAAGYDPGYGDFFGVTALADPDNAGTVATTYPNPATFLAGLEAYQYDAADLRPRMIPKLGAIGLPADTDGTLRAAWLQGLADVFASWDPDVQGWVFGGFIWHNVEDEPGPPLTGLGTRRWYQLDRHTTATDGWDLIAGAPAPPVATFNLIAADNADAAVASPVAAGLAGLPIGGPGAARLMRAEYTILVTDKDLNVLGDPLDGWSSLQVTLRWKEPGSGQIVVPAHSYVREQLVPGCRIVVLRQVLGQQHVLIAGPMEDKLRERADDGDKGGVGLYTISFADDMAWLAARLAYPNPALLPENQVTDFWTYTGNPEQGMLTLVETQAGPSALAARRVPKLVTAAFSGVAGSGTIKLGATSDVAPRERLERLTDVLRRMATLGVGSGYHADSLGFRTRQTQVNGVDVILFEPVRARDLTGEVHFSFGRGNLKYYSYQDKAPTLTHPIVGGQGEGADRFVKEYPTTDPAQLAWGRWEGYVARPGTTPTAEMQDAATEALAETRQNGRLASNAADTIDCRFGVHYTCGDLVSIELDIGEWVIAPVQTVNLQAWPTAGEVVGTTIGDQSARYDSAWISKMRSIDRRLGDMERRAITIV
jgi:hypothetical protein